MNNDLPPSGRWTGFYTYTGGQQRRHRMDLALEFGNGKVTGEGTDDVGPFIIAGRYDPKTGEAHWTKVYVGKHDVFYSGLRSANGISGDWEIGRGERGGFRIWPVADGTGDDDVESEAEQQPVDAVGELAETGLPSHS